MPVWAVVGAGRFAAERMVPAIGSVPGVTLSGVWARETAAAERLAHAMGCATYSSSLAVADDPTVDVVYVAATAASNVTLVTPLLEAGKTVLCEKPLALTSAEALTLADLGDRVGVTCFVNHHLRANSAVTELKSRLDSGQLGPISRIDIVNHQLLPQPGGWRVNDPISGGVVRDLTTHDLDLLNYLVGATVLVDVSASSGGPVETCVRVNLTTEDGAVVSLSDEWVNGAGATAQSRVTVWGAQGSARLDPAVTAVGGVLRVETPEGIDVVAQDGDAFELVAEMVCRSLDGAPVRLTTARSAAVTLEQVEQILHTVAANRRDS